MLRVLIIDDDPLSSGLLAALLAPHEHVAIVGTVGDFATARDRLAGIDYDLVFLEAQFCGGCGFDLVPQVWPQARTVFVTSSDRHAARAFDINALDYLVKPVGGARLAECLRRAQAARPVDSRPRRLASTDRIFLRGTTAGGLFARLDEIAVVLSSENYSEVILTSGERTIVRRTMQAWETIAPVDTFVRVHRTAIVNLARIERVVREPSEQTQIYVQGYPRAVPVSRRLWAELRLKIGTLVC